MPVGLLTQNAQQQSMGQGRLHGGMACGALGRHGPFIRNEIRARHVAMRHAIGRVQAWEGGHAYVVFSTVRDGHWQPEDTTASDSG
jgi:hypothetical protein